MKSARLLRFLVISLSVIFVLCVLEIPAAINFVNYGRVIGPAALDRFAATNKGDPDLLHIHPPHSHFTGESRGGNITSGFRIPQSEMSLYQWDVGYDRNGFRNDVDLENADIAVIGDSFVEEITIPSTQLITSLLSKLQGQVVANLGQYGYGPLEELAVLKRFALPLHPHTVAWMFFEGNDLKDVIHYRGATAELRKAPHFWSAFWDRSFTYNALTQVYEQFKRASKPLGIKRSGIFETSNGDKRTVYFVYSSPGLSKNDLSALEETVGTLAAAHRLCVAQRARLIFVFIPTKFRVLRKFCQFPPQSECRNWAVNDLPEYLRKALMSISSEIGYLDLTPVLQDAAKGGILPYYPDDDHWSPEGHKIAAETIRAYLLSTQTGS